MAASYPTFAPPMYETLARAAMNYQPQTFAPPQYLSLAHAAMNYDPVSALAEQSQQARDEMAQRMHALIAQHLSIAAAPGQGADYSSMPSPYGGGGDRINLLAPSRRRVLNALAPDDYVGGA